LLPQYDLVFGKARAAMEAMAVGAAVILCDFAGVGPLVSRTNVAQLRDLNFGFAALTAPLQAESLVEQIRQYDAADATAVSQWIRQHADLGSLVQILVRLYESVIAQGAVRGGEVADTLPWLPLLKLHVRMGAATLRLWQWLPLSLRMTVKHSPACRPLFSRVKRLLT
jgi:hypothetical protein